MNHLTSTTSRIVAHRRGGKMRSRRRSHESQSRTIAVAGSHTPLVRMAPLSGFLMSYARETVERDINKLAHTVCELIARGVISERAACQAFEDAIVLVQHAQQPESRSGSSTDDDDDSQSPLADDAVSQESADIPLVENDDDVVVPDITAAAQTMMVLHDSTASDDTGSEHAFVQTLDERTPTPTILNPRSLPKKALLRTGITGTQPGWRMEFDDTPPAHSLEMRADGLVYKTNTNTDIQQRVHAIITALARSPHALTLKDMVKATDYSYGHIRYTLATVLTGLYKIDTWPVSYGAPWHIVETGE